MSLYDEYEFLKEPSKLVVVYLYDFLTIYFSNLLDFEWSANMLGMLVCLVCWYAICELHTRSQLAAFLDLSEFV